MLSRLVLRCALSCTLLCATGAGVAEPRSGCQHLRVAFYEDGALFYHAAGGGWTGIDKDVVDELVRRLGCTIEPSVDSRVRIWAGLGSGSIDMSVSAIPLPEREKIGRFVPYMTGRNFVLLHKELSGRLHSMDNFLAHPQYKIAVVKSYKHGHSYEVWLAKLREQGRVFETADHLAMMRLFKLGRVDAVMATPTTWYPLVKQEQLAGTYSVMDWAPRENMVSGLVLSRRNVDAATVARFSQAIRAMREDGTLRRIFERHTDAERAGQMLNF
ncbi:substrate-binding periplasmic protein [Duganella violaceipulchra]|uniref:Polar amino acid transport system substrate-binding protein n=1 Tax=Duganella violaceipulchra TaxID=2849652 RepID=A0AA41H5T7_9BURK|nr:transporter substrate-binding domain-containing protein [Duganella violaceicalia]MBV6322353.1 transporter substrate-binding domain-containing protein [Duganella violaceicalia]MCP2011500.1 polar amino acid transport system substrate-binding protein [Duganella violaceicalia]